MTNRETAMDVTALSDDELLAELRKRQRSRDLVALLAEAVSRGIWPPA